MIKLDFNSFENEIQQTFFKEAQQFEFQKNEIVVRMGTICNHLFFIEKGMLRNFYYDNNGHDVTHWFAREEMIVTAPPSFFKREPSFFGIEAVEHTIVRAVSYEKLEEKLEASIQLERFFRMLATDIMIMLGKRIIDLQTQSAEYRYDQLLMTHPDIFRRAKLGHISGYLGIKQQSLSRIRALKRSGR